MTRYLVRARETRVHILYIDASNMEEAREIAGDMDGENSVSDSFDEWEVLDITPETGATVSRPHGKTP